MPAGMAVVVRVSAAATTVGAGRWMAVSAGRWGRLPISPWLPVRMWIAAVPAIPMWWRRLLRVAPICAVLRLAVRAAVAETHA